MAMQIVCPNGHALTVNENMAGKTGLCPVCKIRMRVPAPRPKHVSEDAVMDMLDEEPVAAAKPEGKQHAETDTERVDAPGSSLKLTIPQARKICRSCRRDIPAKTHVCPFCKVYVG